MLSKVNPDKGWLTRFIRRRLSTARCRTGNLERETGLEPATSSLGSWHSTTELLPLTEVVTYHSTLSGRNSLFGLGALAQAFTGRLACNQVFGSLRNFTSRSG